MNKHFVRLSLAGMAVILASLACSMGTPVAPTASSVPTSRPSPTPAPLNTPIPPTLTPEATLALAPTDTPVLDMEAIMKKHGFARDKTLDSACYSACSAYKNSSVNVIADYYYTNKSFSLLYYAKDKSGSNEQAQSAVITQLLAELYPGNLSSEVMLIADDFSNRLQNSSQGVTGNDKWSVSFTATYNLDKTIKQVTIYIAITPG